MATIDRPVLLILAPSQTGLAASTSYSVVDADGAPLISSTSAGISEISPGQYAAKLADWDDQQAAFITWVVSGVGQWSEELVPAGNSAPSASDVAAAVRTNLTTELGRIDVAVSSRLASASYGAAPSAGTVADAVRTELAPELSNMDAPVSGVPAAVVAGALGGGANDVTIATVDENGDPLAGVLVRARLNGSVQAEGISAHEDPEDTSTPATVRFSLDDGTYRVQGERAGYSNPGLVDLVVDGDTEAEPYELTAQVPAETTPVGTVEIKVPLGKFLVAQEGVQVYIKIQAGTGEIIDLGGQVQSREESQAATDAQGYATFAVPLSSALVAAGLSGRYLARTVENYIPDNSWFEVTGPGVVTLNDPA